MRTIKQALLGIILFCVPFTASAEQSIQTMSTAEICDIIAQDGKTLAVMFANDETPEFISNIIAERNRLDPEMLFIMPGVLRSIDALIYVQKAAPEIMGEPEFLEEMHKTTFEACMREGAIGWTQSSQRQVPFIDRPSPNNKVRI